MLVALRQLVDDAWDAVVEVAAGSEQGCGAMGDRPWPEPLDFGECGLDDLDDALALASGAGFPGRGPIEAIGSEGVGTADTRTFCRSDAAFDADGRTESALVIPIMMALVVVGPQVEGREPLVLSGTGGLCWELNRGCADAAEEAFGPSMPPPGCRAVVRAPLPVSPGMGAWGLVVSYDLP